MTVTAREAIGAADPVLLRLPGAAWRALPSLVTLGLVVFGAWILAVSFFGPVGVLTPVSVAAAAVLPTSWTLGSVQREIFDDPTVWPRRTLLVVLALMVPAFVAGWSIFTASVAAVSSSGFFAGLAVACALAALVVALIAVVAVPIGAMRSDVGISSVIRVAAVAAVRRPLASLTALVVPTVLTWAGLAWFNGLLLLVAPVLILLAVPAAWSTGSALGVTLPRLSPLRRRPTASSIDE